MRLMLKLQTLEQRGGGGARAAGQEAAPAFEAVAEEVDTGGAGKSTNSHVISEICSLLLIAPSGMCRSVEKPLAIQCVAGVASGNLLSC